MNITIDEMNFDAETQIEMGEMIRDEFNATYPHIHADLPAIYFYEQWARIYTRNMNVSDAHVLDLIQDGIMANGLADYDE